MMREAKAAAKTTGLSRRTLLLGGAGAAALLVPGVPYALWRSRNFQRPDFNPAPLAPGEWANWSGAQRITPKSIAVAQTEADIVRIVKSSPAPIRAVGSGHSFTPLVPTPGTILDIGPVSGLIAHDTAARTATLHAGTILQVAAGQLDAVGLALPNLSDIDVQTLAGLFATGTHGTGRTLAPLHDAIIGFRLIPASGEPIDVTEASDPALFAAGKVSMGTLGVMSQFTLRLVDRFALHRKLTIMPMDDLYDRIEPMSHQHRNFEILYLSGTGKAAAITHDLWQGPISGRPPSTDEDTLKGMRDLRDQFGWFPWLRRRMSEGLISSGVHEDTTDRSWKLLSTSRNTRFNEMEYHIPEANGLAALREVIATMDRRPDAFFPIEMRLTHEDDAWLSPFQGGTRMSIAIHAPAEESFQMFFDVFQPIFRRYGGRPHWGKLHTLTTADLRPLYPRFDDFRDVRRRMDPAGKFLNPFTARLFEG